MNAARAILPLVATMGVNAAAMPAPPMPTQIGAAANFSQGWNAGTARAAAALPLRRIRDSIRWADVERSPGRYRFDKPTTTWPDRTGDAAITLTLNWGNPLYDHGATPHSPAALTAFGRFAAAVVARFPKVDRLEIGNEINGGNFVSGPVRRAGLAQRGRYHLAMVRAATDAVRTTRPGVKVIGGAAHSLPAGFIWPLLALPGADAALDGLALHPYTTPIDQLPEQIGFLRRDPKAARLPLHITEFGSQHPGRAADDLMRGFATLAALGVAEMDWYPLNERGDGMVPLLRGDGSLSAAGRAFRFFQARLVGLPARDASPDPFTRIIRFGDKLQVMWGAPRQIMIDPAKVTAYTATGGRIGASRLKLAEDRALVLASTVPLARPGPVQLGCSPQVADSFRQFGFPAPSRAQAAGDGFARFARIGDRLLPLTVLPGQQRPHVPWTPYLGRPERVNLRLTADTLLPATGPQGAIVHRYTAPRAMHAHLQASFIPAADSADGITVSLRRDGHQLLTRTGTAPITIDLPLALGKGDVLELATGPRANPKGDTTRYRIRILDEDKCR